MINLRSSLTNRLHPNLVAVAITLSTWTLPSVATAFMGLQIFAPLPVFYYLVEAGRKRGLIIIGIALFLSGLISVIVGQTGALMFTVLMLPAGMTLAKEAQSKSGGPWQAGLKAFLALVLGWTLWALVYRVSEPGSAGLYGDILASLDQGLIEVGKALKANTQLGPEQALELETTLTGLRGLLPKVMPGLLLTTMLNTVFFNMVFGQYLLRRKSADLAPWPPFATWRLPEPLVVLVILAGLSLLTPVQLVKDWGLSLLLVAGTLYFFQGLSLLTTLLNRWAVPTALRFLIFLLVLVQAYGIVILAVAGLIDVWVNFRKPRPKTEVFED